jgi:hypothetical protein
MDIQKPKEENPEKQEGDVKHTTEHPVSANLCC